MAIAPATAATAAARAAPRSRGGVIRLPAATVAALTGIVVWAAVADLLRHGQLASALAAGRGELVAPVLAIVVAGTLVAERLRPAERRPLLAPGHVQDACYAVLHVVLVVPLMTLLSVGWWSLLARHSAFLELRATSRWPGWLLLGVTIVAMDGANWLAHYGDHRLRTLWRFHRLHHSQEELSVLTSFRAHPLMHTTGFLLATIPVVVLMSHRPVAPVLITAYVVAGTLQHANVPWRFGPLGRIFVSPAYHRLHHATEAPCANLGILLTVWDVLVGCARFPAREGSALPTGLAGRPLAVEQAEGRARPLRLMAAQLAEPFSSPAAFGPRRGETPGSSASRGLRSVGRLPSRSDGPPI